MPPRSRVQAITAAIAEHEPEKLNPENRGMLSMTQKQLSEYASGRRKGLPDHVAKKKDHKPPRSLRGLPSWKSK